MFFEPAAAGAARRSRFTAVDIGYAGWGWQSLNGAGMMPSPSARQTLRRCRMRAKRDLHVIGSTHH